MLRALLLGFRGCDGTNASGAARTALTSDRTSISVAVFGPPPSSGHRRQRSIAILGQRRHPAPTTDRIRPTEHRSRAPDLHDDEFWLALLALRVEQGVRSSELSHSSDPFFPLISGLATRQRTPPRFFFWPRDRQRRHRGRRSSLSRDTA